MNETSFACYRNSYFQRTGFILGVKSNLYSITYCSYKVENLKAAKCFTHYLNDTTDSTFSSEGPSSGIKDIKMVKHDKDGLR